MSLDPNRARADENSPTGETTSSTEKPHLQADIIILTDDNRDIDSHLPNKFPIEAHTDRESFETAVGGNHAVAILSTVYPEESLRSIIRHTVSESEHARIVVVTDDSAELLRYDVPFDEAAVLPREKDNFPDLVKRLYLRSYLDSARESRPFREGECSDQSEPRTEQGGSESRTLR